MYITWFLYENLIMSLINTGSGPELLAEKRLWISRTYTLTTENLNYIQNQK